MATKDLVIFRDTVENKLVETGYLKQNGELQEEVDLQALIDNLPPVLASGNLPAVRKDLISRWQSLRQGVEAIQQRGLYTVYNAEIDYSKGAIVVDNNEDLNVFYSLEDNNKNNPVSDITKWASAFNLKTIANQLSSGQVVKNSTLTYKIADGLVPKNPEMISNTEPTGWTAESGDGSTDAFRVFNKIHSSFLAFNFAGTPANDRWASLQFIKPLKIRQLFVKNANSSTSANTRNVRYEASTDGINWDILHTETDRPSDTTYENTIYITPTIEYSYFRFFVETNWGGTNVHFPTIDIFFAEQDKLTQSIGFINAKDLTSYINFATEIEIDFNTNGLNALSTNTTLSANTWYYIFACKKGDGTSAVIVDSNETGVNANANFSSLGFDTNKTVLAGVWKTETANTNLRNDIINNSPLFFETYGSNVYTYNSASPFDGSVALDIPLLSILVNVRLGLTIENGSNRDAAINIGSPNSTFQTSSIANSDLYSRSYVSVGDWNNTTKLISTSNGNIKFRINGILYSLSTNITTFLQPSSFTIIL